MSLLSWGKPEPLETGSVLLQGQVVLCPALLQAGAASLHPFPSGISGFPGWIINPDQNKKIKVFCWAGRLNQLIEGLVNAGGLQGKVVARERAQM